MHDNDANRLNITNILHSKTGSMSNGPTNVLWNEGPGSVRFGPSCGLANNWNNVILEKFDVGKV